MAVQPQGVEAPSEVYVSFSAMINVQTAEVLIATMSNFANQGVQRVVLGISSAGGAVMAGMNIYNVLRALPFELVTHNVGNVDSIGNAVFLAGDRRYAASHSTFMFHGVSFQAEAGKVFDEKLLRERLESILADQKRIGSILEDRTNLTRQQIATLFRKAATKDVAFAVNAGIVHEVRDFEVPAGVPMFPLIFQN